MPTAELRIEGQRLQTWTDVSVEASVAQMTPAFSFTYVDNRPLEALPVEKGDPCEVILDGIVAMTGIVERVRDRDSNDQGNLYQVTGKGKTVDLVKGTAKHETGRFEKAGLLEIANALCDPYGIEVVIGDEVSPDTLATLGADLAKPWTHWRLERGETVWEALERGARERGVVLVELPDGRLSLTRAGGRKLPTGLQRGGPQSNVEMWERVEDESDQFSEYEFLQQRRGNNSFNGEKARGGRAVVEDPTFGRFRPFTGLAPRQSDSEHLKLHAEHARNKAFGASKQIQCRVSGFTYQEIRSGVPADILWRPNKIVTARNDRKGITGDWLIDSCRYQKSERGSTTYLVLVPPEAYDPPVQPQKKPKARRKP